MVAPVTDQSADEHGDQPDPVFNELACVAIPDVSGLSAYKAALAYADDGMYLLPVDPDDPKNPGSRVGKNWPAKSTRDPDTIEGYWDCDEPPLIAIHTGRSGLAAFDLDIDVLPDELAWMRSGRFQSTRIGDSERGHYVFASTKVFVSGKLTLTDGTHVGEIRSGNSVILTAPSRHAKADVGGRYLWQTTGPVLELPDVARRYLRPLTTGAVGSESAIQTGTQEQVAAFIKSTANADSRPNALTALVASIARQPSGTRDCVRDALRMAAGESRLGFYPYARAVAEIETAARESYAKRRESYDEHIGSAGYVALVANGVAQAMARDIDAIRREATRDYGDKRAQRAELAAGVQFRTELDGLAATALPGDTASQLGSDLAQFWASSAELRDLRQFAQSRRVGPAAMLGNSLARVVAAIPPNVVLPPTIGSVAGLNLFVALVGRSGESKSASMGASADWLTVSPSYSPAKPGSGEGLAKCFASMQKMPGSNGNPPGFVQRGKAWSVLAQLPEVDTLIATGGRGGSTIMSELRSAWSGERLGLDYASEDKRITLCANRYRLCLVLGVQPLRSAPLFDDADSGTPQRFVWLPAGDHDAPISRPDEPARLVLPRWPELRSNGVTDPDVVLSSQLGIAADVSEYRVLAIPVAARELIDSNQFAVLRGDPSVDPLDGLNRPGPDGDSHYWISTRGWSVRFVA
ncbi:hypothetical protein CIW51_05160 [Mycolicibacterium sp. P9-22]|nr:hypothetical protein CIW51_05160 [Mycolicibacterium sp. P9-22]